MRIIGAIIGLHSNNFQNIQLQHLSHTSLLFLQKSLFVPIVSFFLLIYNSGFCVNQSFGRYIIRFDRKLKGKLMTVSLVVKNARPTSPTCYSVFANANHKSARHKLPAKCHATLASQFDVNHFQMAYQLSTLFSLRIRFFSLLKHVECVI